MMLNPQQNDNIGHAAHLGGAFFGLVYSVATQTEAAMTHVTELGIMSLPLLYLAYEIIIKKRVG
jgi:membrane associated rhomboid family serine protease